MPTVRFECDQPLLDRVREVARQEHRPVVWQVTRLINEALDLRERRSAERRPDSVR